MSSATFLSRSASEEQDRLLDEATSNVKRHAFYMKRSMDQSDTTAVIKHAGDMLYELRTGRLSPQNYYDLYMSVTDELRYLESYFEDIHKSTAGASRLYEIVQHAGNIIPRLYLLIAAGSVLIKTSISDQKKEPMPILFDLVELCKGVQHPTRGLFLRSYLSQMSKDIIPDVNSEFNSDKNVSDAIEFVLQNFAEVNKLWVRMQHQGANRDRSRRERERKNLRMLVGTNLVRLSQQESVTLHEYINTVLPRVLEQINACRDKIAQEYLMECLIQVFPDEYHLATLETFLASCASLQAEVDTQDIIISLMNRLSNFALNSPELMPDDMEMFPLFQENTKLVIQSKQKMALEDTLGLQVALVNFASKVYPQCLSYIDTVLSFSASLLQSSAIVTVAGKAIRHVVKLLCAPLETVSVRVLELEYYAAVLSFLDFNNHKQVATELVKCVLDSQKLIGNEGQISTLLEWITPLLRDIDGASYDVIEYEFDQEQNLIARLINLVYADSIDETYELFTIIWKHMDKGGTSRVPYTMPALSFGLLRLARRAFEREQRGESHDINSSKVFRLIHQCISMLCVCRPDMSLRLFLQAAIAADRCSLDNVSYEFLTEAYVVYEEQIASSVSQIAALNLFTTTIVSLHSMQEEGFDAVTTKTLQHCSRLLKKSDQFDRSGSVKTCLQRALKIADSILKAEEQAILLVNVLEHVAFYYEKELTNITFEFVKNIMELTEGTITDLEGSVKSRAVKQRFQTVVSRIRAKQSSSPKFVESTSHMERSIDSSTHNGVTEYSSSK